MQIENENAIAVHHLTSQEWHRSYRLIADIRGSGALNDMPPEHRKFLEHCQKMYLGSLKGLMDDSEKAMPEAVVENN